MVRENKFGLMVLNIKVNGNKVKLVERGNSFMLMVMFMKEIGKMIKLMVTVFIFM